MGLFGRKKKETSAEVGAEETKPEVKDVVEEAPAPSHGPFDISQRDVSKGYLDLGPLKLPAIAGIQIQPLFAPDKKTIMRLNIVVGNSVLQTIVAAAPKSGGAWKQILDGTQKSFEAQGGQVIRNENGPWGEELLVQMPVKTPEGQDAIAPTRIVGVEGNRWVLRIDIVGGAVVDQKAFEAVAALINLMVVERDSEPRPPLSIIPFVIPAELASQAGQ
ncbi:MAG: DUF3710 domain-containing protein [Actinomycetaceae bacterium]|nr:DUF3710 domain-containing protein [Actinomycetaceae bacterium]